MRNYQPVEERTDLANMGEAMVMVTQSDPFRSSVYSINKVTVPRKGFYHRR